MSGECHNLSTAGVAILAESHAELTPNQWIMSEHISLYIGLHCMSIRPFGDGQAAVCASFAVVFLCTFCF